ncbi:hypothetical protein EVAR_58727_1 [Eumeta japonica]|uniref:Uncharacterized protein n=1 Tax=Eumeta variegata TaxID=151549 RepID=A0A4C1YWM8_EUMVA|nr:hypothetical protein EVAR_58727_1 [Eumeta japonica]
MLAGWSGLATAPLSQETGRLWGAQEHFSCGGAVLIALCSSIPGGRHLNLSLEKCAGHDARGRLFEIFNGESLLRKRAKPAAAPRHGQILSYGLSQKTNRSARLHRTRYILARNQHADFLAARLSRRKPFVIHQTGESFTTLMDSTMLHHDPINLCYTFTEQPMLSFNERRITPCFG